MSALVRGDSTHQVREDNQSRKDNLKQREGKSATRTVKQSLAIKHSKVLKHLSEWCCLNFPTKISALVVWQNCLILAMISYPIN